MKRRPPRWRHVNRHRPPGGQQLLLYAPELRGTLGPLDEGVRLGHWDSARRRLTAPGAPNVKFWRWWPYPVPPRVGRLPRLELSGEMLLALDRLRAWHGREPGSTSLIPYGEWGIKVTTMLALLRRGLVKRGGDDYYLP